MSGVFAGEKEKDTNDAVIFRFAKVGDATVAIYNFSNTDTKLLTKVPGFDFSVAHTYGFKNQRGNWWLTVDGVSVVNLSTDDDPVVAQRLDKLSASGKAYVQLASYNGKADFSAINLVDNKGNNSGNADTPVFDLPDGLTAGGNVTDGYTLTGDKNIVAVLRTPIDISNENIQLKTAIPNDWAYLSFAKTTFADTNIFNASKEEGAVSFRLINSNGKLIIYGYTNEKDINLHEISSFNFTKAHTFGFDFIGEDWWLTVDDNAVVNLKSKYLKDKTHICSITYRTLELRQ
mgnify:CR=1 FL=1